MALCFSFAYFEKSISKGCILFPYTYPTTRKPLSRTLTCSVSSVFVVTTTFFGTLTSLTGTAISRSVSSFSASTSQNAPLAPRKNRKIRNSLFTAANRKSLTLRKIIRPSSFLMAVSVWGYFCFVSAAGVPSANTCARSTRITVLFAISTSMMLLSMRFTVP